MDIEIRRIRETEGGLLREVRIAALMDAPSAFGASLADEQHKPLEACQADAKRHAHSQTSTTFFAIIDGEVAGQAGAFIDDGRAWICAMWVAPAARRNQVGSRLFSSASASLSGAGAKAIHAWVADENQTAVAFYKRLGFVATAQTQQLPSDPSMMETLYVCSR
ncbi:MAG: GNAT family N-acetyltransferase [Gammaproteobacteria bacterium]|nr:GNAT family N-acetyltransferase [Gammaproteobacteria bacterium]